MRTSNPTVLLLTFAACAATSTSVGCTTSEEPAIESSSSAIGVDPCSGTPGHAVVADGSIAGFASYDAHGSNRHLFVTVRVDDAAVASRVGGYDGSRERAFACLPLVPGPWGTGPAFRKLDLPWAETVQHHGRPYDFHRATIAWSPELAVENPSRGVFFGLSLPDGRIVWAQWPRHDARAVPVLDGHPPDPTPLPY